MVATALIMLVTKIPIWWFALGVGLIICREIFISALRELMAQQGKSTVIKVGQLGKIKTALQMISIWLLLETCPGTSVSSFDLFDFLRIPKPPIFLFSLFLFFSSVSLTLISGLQYIIASSTHLLKSTSSN